MKFKNNIISVIHAAKEIANLNAESVVVKRSVEMHEQGPFQLLPFINTMQATFSNSEIRAFVRS